MLLDLIALCVFNEARLSPVKYEAFIGIITN
jgi:hypothetical protein